MKYFFLNDTKERMGIHSGSVESTKKKAFLDPGESIWVSIEEDTYPWIKVWGNVVLLSYINKGHADIEIAGT